MPIFEIKVHFMVFFFNEVADVMTAGGSNEVKEPIDRNLNDR